MAFHDCSCFSDAETLPSVAAAAVDDDGVAVPYLEAAFE